MDFDSLAHELAATMLEDAKMTEKAIELAGKANASINATDRAKLGLLASIAANLQGVRAELSRANELRREALANDDEL
jgi:hypothetical protein